PATGKSMPTRSESPASCGTRRSRSTRSRSSRRSRGSYAAESSRGTTRFSGTPSNRRRTPTAEARGAAHTPEERAMKDGLRFVDSDMHIMEPPDLFDRYLDPKFKDRVSVPMGADGKPKRGAAGLTIVDGLPTSDVDIQQYRKRVRHSGPQSTQPLSGSRLFDTGRLDLAIERDYAPVAQVMGMEMEGVDIAVNYPTAGLALLGRDNMDPQMSLAICQAYNNWIHEFCSYRPDQLKWVAMLPVHDVHLACKELVRCVRELGAVGSFIRPNLVNGHYWHSNYWDPLYSVHEELNATWGFHEGVSALYSRMIPLYGENRFYRHVASHWIEMQ